MVFVLISIAAAITEQNIKFSIECLLDYPVVILHFSSLGNSHEIDIFQTIETTEFKLSLYEIFLVNHSRVHFRRYFRHLAQLIGDVEGGSVF